MQTDGTAARRGRRGRRGSRVRATGGSILGSNSSSSSSSGLLHLRRTSASGLGSGLDSRRSVEAASISSTVLLYVILVQSKGKLLLGCAHAVSTILAGSSIGCQSAAVGVTADGAEQLGVLRGGEGSGDNAAGSIIHALAQIDIGSRGQGGGFGSPPGSDGRAASQGGVGGSVGGLVDTSGVCAGDLAGIVFEVGHGADTGAIDDRNQTCNSNQLSSPICVKGTVFLP